MSLLPLAWIGFNLVFHERDDQRRERNQQIEYIVYSYNFDRWREHLHGPANSASHVSQAWCVANAHVAVA